MTAVEQFFQRYEAGANNFDPDLVSAQYTDSFMGADPNGVVCIANDDKFRAAIPQRKEFFKQIGFRSAKVLDVAETSLDDRYTMAKVYWQMIFENDQGGPQEFKFYITYFLFDPGSGLKVVFYISHDDEQKVMRDAGLIK